MVEQRLGLLVWHLILNVKGPIVVPILDGFDIGHFRCRRAPLWSDIPAEAHLRHCSGRPEGSLVIYVETLAIS